MEKIIREPGPYCLTCTTLNQVVNHLAYDRDFIISVREGINYNWRDDMLQDIYLYLLEMDEIKIMSLNESGYLPFFVYGIIRNQLKENNRTDTFKKYRNFLPQSEFSTKAEREVQIELDNTEREGERLEIIYQAIEVLKKRDPNFWYKTKLMFEYIGLGDYECTGELTYKQLAEFLKIKMCSITWATNQFRADIRKEIKDNKTTE